jgi:hypothetical protein
MILVASIGYSRWLQDVSSSLMTYNYKQFFVLSVG